MVLANGAVVYRLVLNEAAAGNCEPHNDMPHLRDAC